MTQQCQYCFFFSSRRRHTRLQGDWSSDVCSSDLAPISRLDLLACRNTLIYFNLETQRQVLDRFNFALNETGFLFLGRAEMLLMHANQIGRASCRERG